MSDIRDSGNIEQDADVIIFLYRDSYHEQLQKEKGQPLSKKETLEFIVAKNRKGHIGVASGSY